MADGFIALGLLCILYYILLVWYTKRWNGTFMLFWPFAGMLYIVTGVVVSAVPIWISYLVTVIFFALILIFIFVEILILSGMLLLAPKNLDYLIVLGAQIRGERVTEALRRRLDRAVSYLNDNPDTIAIVSGGQGKGETITEAMAMRHYLIREGIDEHRIILEEQSRSTYENLRNSLIFIRGKKSRVGLVSNNFHLYRAVKLAKIVGYEKVYAVVASCNIVVFANYMVREFFAIFAMYIRLRKRKHEK